MTFEAWWYNTGSGIAPFVMEDRETHARRVAIAAWEAAENDNDRWMREVLTDFKIQFDDHPIGRRLAFTQWMADHQ